MKSHPYADLFPMMSEVELEALVQDISRVGLRSPILRYQKMILDGRNRLAACKKANVEPRFEDFEGTDEEALALVISLNMERRHLTGAQKAIVAAKRWGLEEKTNDPKKNGTAPIRSSSLRQLAKQFHVGQTSITQARNLLREAPDLAEQVFACTMSLATACEQSDRRHRETVIRTKYSKEMAEYAEAISKGELTFEEAFRRVQEKLAEEKEKKETYAIGNRIWWKKLVEIVEWFGMHVGWVNDESLLGYNDPEMPGWFDHGITSESIDQTIVQLERVRNLVLGISHPPKKQKRQATPQ
jgi:hypothetical protein